MANHKSSLKRIRQSETKRVHNKYYARTTRNAIKELRGTSDKVAAQELLPKVSSMLDKLAKKSIIHKNKASNLKSSLALHVNALQ
ncbi:MAG: 30S ribosomal protein S20 [Bacteroidetes bacterium HGW-Bacteroidetes-15]|nr:MAG: 30S ribosomal protein S20 [Bacteroidetes bacterium HGW-Bacteroidetes-15]